MSSGNLEGYSYSNSAPPLSVVGRTVSEVWITPDGGSMVWQFVDGPAQRFDAEGDCCSYSWIQSIENIAALLGSPIIETADIYLPTDDGRVTKAQEEAADCLAVYGIRIDTAQGSCVIDFRNDSNGYYGGNLTPSVCEGPQPSMVRVTEDWSL